MGVMLVNGTAIHDLLCKRTRPCCYWLLAILALPLTGSPVAWAQELHPYLQLTGTLRVGQPAARHDEEVAFSGTGFCAAADCSDISLTIGDRIVANNIRPAGNGTFSGRFQVTEPPGFYLVRASQTSGQTKIEDVKPLLVPVAETR
jgi:hypothetical protein